LRRAKAAIGDSISLLERGKKKSGKGRKKKGWVNSATDKDFGGKKKGG